MSKEITCKQCGYENPHSSKFCNNCGAKLPLGTHIICPSCETPNTRDRIFCDTCGTRLVAESPQLKPESPPEKQPPANEPFSLPVRRPGDTGELDPNAVPDWLRTGDIGSEKGEAAETSSPSDKKDASDLPDWLVHESDPSPIINAPTTISTEFFKDLVERATDLPQPDDLFADEEDADLPDWLSEADEAVTDEARTSAGLTDWLSDLSNGKLEEETAVPQEEPDDDVSTGLTDWLSELDDMASPAEAHAQDNADALDELLNEQPSEEPDSADWLHELGPAQTDLFPAQTDEQSVEDDDDSPGWIDELGPIQTNLLDPSQIAQLTGSLSGISEDAGVVDDEEAGADISFTQLFESAGDATETLPDWLDTTVEEGESFLSEPAAEATDEEESDVVSEASSDWFTAEQIVAETDLDWLSDTGSLETMADNEALSERQPSDPAADDALVTDDETDADFAFADELAEDDMATPASALFEADDADFDWLSDMEKIETGELSVEPEPEETAVPLQATTEFDEAPPVETKTEPEPEPDEDNWSSETFFQETAVSDDLPDWLTQLDEKGQTAGRAEMESASKELPDWIASMRPSEGFVGSELPGVFSEMDIRDTLEGIPEELAGAELPDWLQDTPLDNAPPKPFVALDKGGTQEIPDWLQPDTTEAETDTPTPKPVIDPANGGRTEWRSLLEMLPPLTPLAESLPKADIPEWVQQLKPPELTGEPPREPEGPKETAGPLKGLHGIVTIEPIIARPQSASLLQAYVTTPEQQQQVALLRQLTQEMPVAAATLATKTSYSTAVWLRLLLAILLMVALLVGLNGPSLVATNGAVPANVQAVAAAVTTAAGQPVLVAIEYTPAMAGELSPQAELLLTQLAANGSPVLITSQYAAGTAVASSLSASTNAQMVGYLPGEGVGLRQLGECLAGRVVCDQLNGRLLDDDLQASLSQVGLVIVITGDRDNLVNWVEQVGSVATRVPLIAGVTQALTPLTNSYAATGQISGLLGGIPDAAAYERLVGQPTNGLQTQLNAQIVGQLLAAALLFAGLLVYGTTGLMQSRQDKNQVNTFGKTTHD